MTAPLYAIRNRGDGSVTSWTEGAEDNIRLFRDRVWRDNRIRSRQGLPTRINYELLCKLSPDAKPVVVEVQP